jgi:hypothetical protein
MVDGIADTEAAKLVLPQAVIKRLGLPLADEVTVRVTRTPFARLVARRQGHRASATDGLLRSSDSYVGREQV